MVKKKIERYIVNGCGIPCAAPLCRHKTPDARKKDGIIFNWMVWVKLTGYFSHWFLEAIIKNAVISKCHARYINRVVIRHGSGREEVAEHLAKHWGGSGIYFPMGMTYKLSQRDRQIYSEFKGNNHFELAQKYGVSVIWIYKIIRTVQKEELASRQKDMSGQ